MKTLHLTLDDSPDAALFLALVRGASFITAVREEPTEDAASELPLLWAGDPNIDPFAGEPLQLRTLAEIRRGVWDRGKRLKFLLADLNFDQDAATL